jgi:hypothetical protein
MQKEANLERYLRFVLILNGLGDIVLGIFMLFLPGQLAGILGFNLTHEIRYLVGGWGTASLAFGVMRLFAGTNSHPEVRWFVAAFGLFEGVVLTLFGIGVSILTSLKFRQVSLSTLFALAFALAYGAACLWRRASNRQRI